MEGIADAISSLGKGIKNVIDVLGTIVDGIVSGVTDVIEWLLDGIVEIIEWLYDGVSALFGGLIDALWSALSWVVDAIGNLLSALFIPDNELFSSKINQMRSNFKFIDTILSIVDTFKSALSGSNIQKLNVDLSDANGKYDYGGTVSVLDTSWYAPYKPYGDKVLSALMWALFVFNVYRQLPSIINGGGSALISYKKNSE